MLLDIYAINHLFLSSSIQQYSNKMKMCVGNVCVSCNLATIVVKPHLVAIDELQHHHLIHGEQILKEPFFSHILYLTQNCNLRIPLPHHSCPCLSICYSSSGPPIAVQLDVERLENNL